MCGPEDRFTPEEVLAHYDYMAWVSRPVEPLAVRKRAYFAGLARERENATVRTLLELAERRGTEEHSVRPVDQDGASLAAEFSRLPALRSLARSRGVTLETVLRSALRDELRSIVELPPVGSGSDKLG